MIIYLYDVISMDLLLPHIAVFPEFIEDEARSIGEPLDGHTA